MDPNRLCNDCEIHTTERTCFCCGRPTKPASKPHLTSQHGYGRVMSTDQWEQVRRQVLAD